MLNRLIVGLADACRRNAIAVVIAGILITVLSVWVAYARLGVTTDTDLMFSSSLAWRQRATQYDKEFPQFRDLLVAVVSAREPEEAEATAKQLAEKLAADHQHFISVTRPDASPFFTKEGFLFLDLKQLTALMNKTIDAQPFLGQLVADPTARGLFSALSLLGMGVTQNGVDLSPYAGPITAFHTALHDVLTGHPQPLSWQLLLGGGLSDLAGQYHFVLAKPKQNFGTLQPGGAATEAMRDVIANLPYVKSGAAQVRITGQIALADEEFASVAEGTVQALIVSVVLITLWLFLAVKTWRLIVPILMTLTLGLALTLLFAAVAVGTLNLVSVGFGVLFVGIAVDFTIQFSVRYREQRFLSPVPEQAMRGTAALTGTQILVASVATAAGFLAFVPTSFSGVAELGAIAGVGMLIAFICTLTFLPAAITLFHPPGEISEVGFHWARPLDGVVTRRRKPILLGFLALAVAAIAVSPHLQFDANPLDTKNPNTEAMRTLKDLISNPVTNPYTIDIVAPSVQAAAALAPKLKALPSVDKVIDINGFVPDDQKQKLAVIADANSILAPTIAPPSSPAAPITADQVRMAAKVALGQIESALAKLPPSAPLALIAGDLKQLETASDKVALEANDMLTRFLPDELDRLRTALSAEPVTVDTIPASVKRDWVLPDGRARMEVTPKPLSNVTQNLYTFVDQVTKVAPDAAGSAVTIVATSNTIITAFRNAGIYAVVAIAVLLLLALQRLREMALVLAPLLLSALLTLLVAVLLPMPLNFANIIALPLLLGVGVSFNIYFVMNWRAGRSDILGSATARAIVFSALTTGTAFGSLALSAHPGTASMGELLLISLGCTLIASLVFIPALLFSLRPPQQ